MKKAMLFFLAVIIAIFCMTTPLIALDDVHIVIDGTTIYSEPAPIIEEGRILIPLRAVTENIGGRINWDPANQEVSGFRGTYSFRLTIGSNEAVITGNQTCFLDVPAKIIEGRTFVPLRFVTESLGCDAYWDSNSRTASIKAREINIVMDVSNLVLPSLVKITTDKGMGSGFFWSDDGEIITNAHVIVDANWIKVKTYDQIDYNASVMIEDGIIDLAKIKIDCPGRKCNFIQYYTEYSDVYVGQNVIALGNPYGLEGTVSTGIISSIRQSFEPMNGMSIYQITAPISPGNSGGPLLDEEGCVLGINSGSWIGGENINFAIPIDYVFDMQHRPSDTAYVDYLDYSVNKLPAWLEKYKKSNEDMILVNSYTANGDRYSALRLLENEVIPNLEEVYNEMALCTYASDEVNDLLSIFREATYCLYNARIYFYRSLSTLSIEDYDLSTKYFDEWEILFDKYCTLENELHERYQ